MTTTPLAPSDTERAEWPDNTRNYVEWLEREFAGPDPDPTDLTTPSNIPFGQLPRATQEAMVIAHVLDGAVVQRLFSVAGEQVFLRNLVIWDFNAIYRVVQP